jgi:hypothetical protein
LTDNRLLTSELKRAALDAGNLLVCAINEFRHGSHSFLGTAVDLEENALEGTAFTGGLIARLSHNGGGAEESAQRKQPVTELLLAGLGSLSDNLFPERVQFLLVRLLHRRLLVGQSVFVVLSELFEVGDLLLDLGDIGLEGGLLQRLGFLVGVDLLVGDELVQRLSGVLGQDGVDFGGGVLWAEARVSLKGELGESLGNGD